MMRQLYRGLLLATAIFLNNATYASGTTRDSLDEGGLALDDKLINEVCTFVSDPHQPPGDESIAEYAPNFDEGISAWTQRVGWIDTNNDGHVDFIARTQGGTAHVNTETITTNGKQQTITNASDDDEEKYRWSGWGDADSQWLNYKGYIFNITFNDRQGKHPSYLWYTDKTNKRTRLCDFKTIIKDKYGYASDTLADPRAAMEICSEVPSGKLKATVRPNKTETKIFANETTASQYLMADVFNDGNLRKLWLAEYSSGRGAGCSSNFYLADGDQKIMSKITTVSFGDTIDDPEFNSKAMKDLPLLSQKLYEAQNVDFSNGGSIAPCGKSSKLLQARGITMLEVEDPGDELKQNVYLIRNRQLQKFCEITRESKTTYKRPKTTK